MQYIRYRLPCKALHAKIVVSMLLPDDYGYNDRQYSVIYMCDGQNCFDDAKATYGHGLKMDKAFADAHIDNDTILVAVHTPNNWKKRINQLVPCQGKFNGWQNNANIASQYRQWWIDYLVPYIDSHYATIAHPDNRALIGSSAGGMFALHIAYQCQLFGNIGSLSNCGFYTRDEYLQYLTANVDTRAKVYLYCGGDEHSSNTDYSQQYTDMHHDIANILQSKGVDFAQHYNIEGEHNEANWQSPIADMLTTLPWRKHAKHSHTAKGNASLCR